MKDSNQWPRVMFKLNKWLTQIRGRYKTKISHLILNVLIGLQCKYMYRLFFLFLICKSLLFSFPKKLCWASYYLHFNIHGKLFIIRRDKCLIFIRRRSEEQEEFAQVVAKKSRPAGPGRFRKQRNRLVMIEVTQRNKLGHLFRVFFVVKLCVILNSNCFTERLHPTWRKIREKDNLCFVMFI